MNQARQQKQQQARTQITDNPVFMFLAEEANIAWDRWEKIREDNTALRNNNRRLSDDLRQTREVIIEQFHMLGERDREIDHYRETIRRLRMQNNEYRNEVTRLRRLNAIYNNRTFRTMPTSFAPYLNRTSSTETEVEETDIDVANMGGQDESDEDFDITR